MNRKIILTIILIIFALIGLFTVYYINDYYHANSSVDEYIHGKGNVNVIKTSNGMLLDGPGNNSAVIFYPGAKVEYTSYLPLMTQIADKGIDCFLVEMPLNIAFLGENSADEILRDYNYDHYYMAGHSLGGVVASDYINKTNNTDGLILLESYSTVKIDKPVLSVYGSEDKVLNMEKYNESRLLISKNLTEIIIKGANHAQIGNYGAQSGDGTAKITSQNQQKQTAEAVIKFIKK